MGDYHAVVPTDWNALTRTILPAWCEALSGRSPVRPFARRFAPGMAAWLDEVWPALDAITAENEISKDQPAAIGEPFDITWERWRRRSGDYLADIGWMGPTHVLTAAALHRSREHQRMEQLDAATLGVWFLMEAIRRHGAVELAGEDADGLDRSDGYYARLHANSWSEGACVKVAGTKNRYRFLDAAFKFDWDGAQGYAYRCEPLMDGSPSLVDHLAALFLSVRAFPGTSQLTPPMTWPAVSDAALVGYLAPGEVRELAAHLAWLGGTPAAIDDHLFPLFADRVQRSAAAGLALVTFYSGL
jgi:hypothetical protein